MIKSAEGEEGMERMERKGGDTVTPAGIDIVVRKALMPRDRGRDGSGREGPTKTPSFQKQLSSNLKNPPKKGERRTVTVTQSGKQQTTVRQVALKMPINKNRLDLTRSTSSNPIRALDLTGTRSNKPRNNRRRAPSTRFA